MLGERGALIKYLPESKGAGVERQSSLPPRRHFIGSAICAPSDLCTPDGPVRVLYVNCFVCTLCYHVLGYLRVCV